MARMKQSALRHWSVLNAAGASWPQRFRWRHQARYVAERTGSHSVDGQNRASVSVLLQCFLFLGEVCKKDYKKYVLMLKYFFNITHLSDIKYLKFIYKYL